MDLKLHQIWYRDEHEAELDPNLLSWDNRVNERSEWCEYWIMRQAAKDFDKNFGELTGFFSWKYRQKLNIEYSQIKGYIEAYPGADCYIFSPAVFQVSFYLNVWQQGEMYHPGIAKKAQAILESMGIHVHNLENTVDHHLTTAYSNYWIANQKFWKAYLSFMDGVFNYIEAAFADDQHGFWELAHGSKGGEEHVQFLPVIPYLVERMFSVFIKLHPEFKVVSWQFPLDMMQTRVHGMAGMVPIANWLKFMFAETKDKAYLHMFVQMQEKMQKELVEVMARDEGLRVR